MKPITLLVSTALTGALLAAVPAEAAKIKLRPVAVKVAPKIQAPSPKIKMKLKAPTPKVVVKAPARVRVKVKTPDIAPRIKPDVRIATPTVRPAVPAIRVAPQVKPRIAIGIAPKVAAPTVAPRVKPAATISKLEPKRIPVPSVAPHAGDSGGPLNRPDFADAGEAAQAAGAAQAAREAANLGAMRDVATPGLGFDTPDLAGGEFRSNRDILGARDTARGGWMGGPSLGGAGVPELGNSHGKDTPANPWAVTPGSIASAVGGVAGGVDAVNDVPDYSGGVTGSPDRTYRHGWSGDTDVYTTENYQDGTKTEVITGPDGRSIVETYSNGDRAASHTTSEGEVLPGEYETAPAVKGTDELRNPEYAGGGCQSMDCILNGGASRGFTLADLEKQSPNQTLPAGPDQANGNGGSSGSAIITQEDLLSQYDPDNDGPGGNRARLEDICMHSECP